VLRASSGWLFSQLNNPTHDEFAAKGELAAINIYGGNQDEELDTLRYK